MMTKNTSNQKNSENPLADNPGSSGDHRIAVAVSGGVDSSFAAALLKRKGFDVIGVTLKLHEWSRENGIDSCCGRESVERARAFAEQIDMPHHVFDCVDEFDKYVLQPAWEEYDRGRTPNPCLLCNEQIKFGVLLQRIQDLGIRKLATGHYAFLETGCDRAPVLMRGKDPQKDQSYFLAGLNRDQLASVIFPLGEMTKHEVRTQARLLGLNTAETSESQDACFLDPDCSFPEFLRKRFSGESKPGNITDTDDRVLGDHKGIHLFTVGQRKGIQIKTTERCWVKSVRAEDSTVVVTWNEDDLLRNEFAATDVTWTGDAPLHHETDCEVQVRYRQPPVPAIIRPIDVSGSSFQVTLQRAVRAVTPGQAAVFFQRDRVLGRGWISSA